MKNSYYGTLVGYGDLRCVYDLHTRPGDESSFDVQARAAAIRYMKRHLSRVPLVVAARVGREFGLFDPFNQIRDVDAVFESRQLIPAETGLWTYYLLMIASLFGAVTLRRRRITLVPFLGILVEVVLSAAASIGSTRYRVPFEVALVVLAAVAIDRAIALVWPSAESAPGQPARPSGTGTPT